MQLKKLSHSHGIAGTSASAAAAASKVNESSELSTSVQRPPYPSPPPAPQRVPHPPARTSNQNLTKTRFFSGSISLNTAFSCVDPFIKKSLSMPLLLPLSFIQLSNFVRSRVANEKPTKTPINIHLP